MAEESTHFTVAVIGSGFGGSMTALPLAHRFKKRAQNETVVILERGTWWTAPVSTVQDKEVRAKDLMVEKKQPVQTWSSQNHFRGFIDLFTRCFRRTKDVNIFTRLFRRLRNEDGRVFRKSGGYYDGLYIADALIIPTALGVIRRLQSRHSRFGSSTN